MFVCAEREASLVGIDKAVSVREPGPRWRCNCSSLQRKSLQPAASSPHAEAEPARLTQTRTKKALMCFDVLWRRPGSGRCNLGLLPPCSSVVNKAADVRRAQIKAAASISSTVSTPSSSSFCPLYRLFNTHARASCGGIFPDCIWTWNVAVCCARRRGRGGWEAFAACWSPPEGRER